MKPHHLTNLLVASAFVLPGAYAGAATLVHAVGKDGGPTGQLTSTSSFITDWDDAGVDGTASSVTSAAIVGDVGGEAFTYQVQIAFTGSAGAESLAEVTTGQLLGSDFAVFNETTDQVTISIINISNALVQFDGFTRFSNGSFNRNTTNDDIVDVSGTDYTGDTGNLAFDLVGGPIATFVYTPELSESGLASSTVSLRYVDFQFSNIPEPGSLALLGLGGLCVLRRRRV